MYSFKIVITTVMMVECKLHIALTKALVCSDSAGTYAVFPLEVYGASYTYSVSANQTRSEL